MFFMALGTIYRYGKRCCFKYIFKDNYIHPHAVFINSGLHEIWNGGDWEKYNTSSRHIWLTDLRHDIDNIQIKYPKVAFFHQCPLGMTYTFPDYNKNLEEYCNAVKDVWSNSNTINNHVLDMFKASLKLFNINGCSKGDGIHFNRKCFYSVLITQWHLTWLKYMKIIDIIDDIKNPKKYLR